MTLPPSDPPYPCVVMAHGFGAHPAGPVGLLARRLAAVGLAGLAFDFRGFGASDGERHILSVDRHLEDWRAAIAWASAREEIDARRIAAWGSSLTGGEVVALAAENGGLAAAVAQVPYCDGYALARAAGLRHGLKMLPAVVRDLAAARLQRPAYLVPALGPPGGRGLMNMRYGDLYERLQSSPPPGWENKVAARGLREIYRFRPIRNATEIRCPLLVVVTYQDKVSPPTVALRAAERLPYVELAMFSGRHFEVYRDELLERMATTEASFLAHHLLGPRPPASLDGTLPA